MSDVYVKLTFWREHKQRNDEVVPHPANIIHRNNMYHTAGEEWLKGCNGFKPSKDISFAGYLVSNEIACTVKESEG